MLRFLGAGLMHFSYSLNECPPQGRGQSYIDFWAGQLESALAGAEGQSGDKLTLKEEEEY